MGPITTTAATANDDGGSGSGTGTSTMIDYFTGIGFPLPSQMNPTDFYMDVISGLIPRKNNPNFKKEDLFDLWINYKNNNNNNNSNNNSNQDDSDSDSNNTNNKIEASSLLLSSSTTTTTTAVNKKPGIVVQIYLLFKRAVLQRCRVPRNTIIPVCLSAATGGVIGYCTTFLRGSMYYGIPLVVLDKYNAASEFMYAHPTSPISYILNTWLMTDLGMILVCITSLNTFGFEEAIYLRESFSGTNPFSYWLAKTCEAGMWLPLYSAIFVTSCFAFQPTPLPIYQYWLVMWTSMIGFCGVGVSSL
jgi:hypothetical protein